MALVVFLRGINVGGHKVFQPTALARELADFDVVNVGAAGTFVVRNTIAQAKLRAEILQRLPVQAEVMICASREVLDLAMPEGVEDEASQSKVTRYVSILANRPRSLPALPLRQPDSEDWQVKVLGVAGRFALSLHRRLGPRLVYPNEVVEKHLGLSATTRNWNTIAAICAILKEK
jgi:uncharacterized protein (DUF1697 family)